MEIELAGSYPIILEGETVGEITVAREGLFWSFEAECEPRNEIVRLSVYGDGKESYLGIMEPFGDMLKLTKKFSRAALKEFPMNITHAGQKGEIEIFEAGPPEDRPTSEAVSEYRGEFPHTYFKKANNLESYPPEENKPPPDVTLSPSFEFGKLIWHPCPLPCSLFTGVEAKRFCSYITGAFVAQDCDTFFLAVPEDVAAELPDLSAIHFIDKIIISDNIYLICKIKQGKSVSEL